MGMSASADLGFGVLVGAPEDSMVFWDEDTSDGGSDEHWEQRDAIEELSPYDLNEIIAVRKLIAEGHKFTGDYDEDYEAYSAAQKELEAEFGKYGKGFPVEAMVGGTYEYSQNAIVLNDKRFRGHAYWGAEAVEIEQPTAADIDKAFEFCARFSLPSFAEAKWILSAHYG